jgi:imidazolonepropionase-like amidohydrolase
VVCLLTASLALQSADAVSIVNARVFPVSGPVIEKATLVIEAGRIAAVGPTVRPKPKSRVIDGAGLSVYPGWIDGWSQVGLVEISGVAPTVDTAEIGPFNPAAKAWISVNPHSEMIRTARVNGITTALVAPSGGMIAGTAAAMNLFGTYPNEMLVLGDAGVVMNVPSQRRAPRREGLLPADPRANRAEEQLTKLKAYLREAKRYSDARARAGANFPQSLIDSSLEALLPVIRGQRPVICPADHFRDIRTAVELGEEFGLKVLIAGGADAWKIADYLQQKKVGVLFSAVLELPGNAEDPYDALFAAPEALRKAGVPFAIVSGTSADVRNLPYRAAVSAAYGLEREDALKSITLWPAQLLGIGDKVGSLEPGKLANLIVVKGDPLDIRSEIRHVFIEGKEVPPDNRNLEMFERFGSVPAPTRD